MTYKVYHNAGWNAEIKASKLDEAMAKADKLIAYCGESIYLTDGETTYMRRWYGVPATEDDLWDDGDPTDIIGFGDHGFYGPWREVTA